MNLVTPELGLIVWQTITFLLILLVLSRFAWRPILNSLKEREQSIEQALASADKARQEMQNLQANNQKMLDEARVERDQMIKAAKKAADEYRAEEKDRTAKEINMMLEDAKRLIDSEKQAAVNEIKAQIAGLSIEIAEKILKKQLESKDVQKQFVSDLIQELKIN